MHRRATQVLSSLMALLGAVMLVGTVASGGGPLATGVVFGVLLLLAGLGRLWVASQRGGGL